MSTSCASDSRMDGTSAKHLTEKNFSVYATTWSPTKSSCPQNAPCGLAMQQVNIHNEVRIQNLHERREVDYATHLAIYKKLYYKQVRRGDHAHVEHPAWSLAWDTRNFKNLPGHRAIFEQCAYGATAEADDGSILPIKKITRLQTTTWAIYQLMSKRCDGLHHHQRLEGRNRCRKAEDYQQELAATLVHGLLINEGLNEQIYAVYDDDKALIGVLRKLGTMAMKLQGLLFGCIGSSDTLERKFC